MSTAQTGTPNQVDSQKGHDLDSVALGGADAAELIRALAEGQHGVVAHRQLIAAGLGPALIHGRVQNGSLIPVHRGVYALGHRRFDRRHLWMAGVLASGPQAVLSHASAAHLWDLRGSRGPVHVTRPTGGGRHRGVRVHQSHTLQEAERTVEAAIPVTTIERTLLDVAAELDLRQLERAVVAGDRCGRMSWRRLERMLRKGAGRTGVNRLRKVVAASNPDAVYTRSGIEVDLLALCREAGIGQPEVNSLVGGRMVDFLWRRERVVVEVDSYRYHHDRPAFHRDHRSTVALEAAGYRVHRITDEMLAADPHPFLELVDDSIRKRRREIESTSLPQTETT